MNRKNPSNRRDALSVLLSIEDMVRDILKEIRLSRNIRPVGDEPSETEGSARDDVEQTLFDYYSRHFSEQGNEIRASELMEHVPGLRKKTGNSLDTLAQYLRYIKKDPHISNMSLEYCKMGDTRRWNISINLTPQMIGSAANDTLKSEGYVTWLELREYFGISWHNLHERRPSQWMLRRMLDEWASETNLEKERLLMGGRVCPAYYVKGKRPPITPREKITPVLGGRDYVSSSEIQAATKLEPSTIGQIMWRLGFKCVSGKEEEAGYRKREPG